MKFEVGKLYKCLSCSLLIYPMKEKPPLGVTAAISPLMPGALSDVTSTEASDWAKYWSKTLNCQVRYSEPNEVFMFLKRDEVYLYTLFGEKQGWVITRPWLKIVEAQNEV